MSWCPVPGCSDLVEDPSNCSEARCQVVAKLFSSRGFEESV